MRILTHRQKDIMAKKVIDDWCDFGLAFTDKGKYPREAFYAFFKSAWAYAEATRRHRLIHRNVAHIINGLTETIECGRKRVPDKIIYDADRLECLFFCGYDPHFDGFEPPGL